MAKRQQVSVWAPGNVSKFLTDGNKSVYRGPRNFSKLLTVNKSVCQKHIRISRVPYTDLLPSVKNLEKFPGAHTLRGQPD